MTDLPAPASFYRRPLPAGLIPFASPEGRTLFQEALAAGGMEGWFALAEQFHTQADPAFCGLGTLVVVLNTLEIDPGRVWKGPWRWYGEDLLDCCLPLEQVRQKGITLDELACLARCNGATARAVRADQATIDDLRQQVRLTTSASRGPVLVAGYSRALLGQTGEGHFSPIAGYHPGRDLVLILDVARFKYPPHWVPLAGLWHAMTGVDPVTGRPRGFILFDRGEQRALPLYFRLTAGDGLGTLAATLLGEAPAALAQTTGNSAAEVVAGWVEQVESRLGERLCRGLGPRIASPAELPPDHRRAVEAVLGELHTTAIHRAISQARTADRQGLIPDDLLAMLLLALPDSALAALPEAALPALASLRDPAQLGPALGAEVAALRAQMTTLGEWQASGEGARMAPPPPSP
jgi:glutathione gamma-glutamylcysteinyltransferase